MIEPSSPATAFEDPPRSGSVSSCVFCDVVAGRAQARVVYESSDALAFFPDAPAVRGHTLVVPKVHVQDFLDVKRPEAIAVADACIAVGRALKAELAPAGMNLLTSAGEAASQTVFHLHVHLLPRWEGDALGDIWPEVPPSDADELDALAAALRQSFAG